MKIKTASSMSGFLTLLLAISLAVPPSSFALRNLAGAESGPTRAGIEESLISGAAGREARVDEAIQKLRELTTPTWGVAARRLLTFKWGALSKAREVETLCQNLANWFSDRTSLSEGLVSRFPALIGLLVQVTKSREFNNQWAFTVLAQLATYPESEPALASQVAGIVDQMTQSFTPASTDSLDILSGPTNPSSELATPVRPDDGSFYPVGLSILRMLIQRNYAAEQIRVEIHRLIPSIPELLIHYLGYTSSFDAAYDLLVLLAQDPRSEEQFALHVPRLLALDQAGQLESGRIRRVILLLLQNRRAEPQFALQIPALITFLQEIPDNAGNDGGPTTPYHNTEIIFADLIRYRVGEEQFAARIPQLFSVFERPEVFHVTLGFRIAQNILVWLGHSGMARQQIADSLPAVIGYFPNDAPDFPQEPDVRARINAAAGIFLALANSGPGAGLVVPHIPRLVQLSQSNSSYVRERVFEVLSGLAHAWVSPVPFFDRLVQGLADPNGVVQLHSRRGVTALAKVQWPGAREALQEDPPVAQVRFFEFEGGKWSPAVTDLLTRLLRRSTLNDFFHVRVTSSGYPLHPRLSRVFGVSELILSTSAASDPMTALREVCLLLIQNWPVPPETSAEPLMDALIEEGVLTTGNVENFPHKPDNLEPVIDRLTAAGLFNRENLRRLGVVIEDPPVPEPLDPEEVGEENFQGIRRVFNGAIQDFVGNRRDMTVLLASRNRRTAVLPIPSFHANHSAWFQETVFRVDAWVVAPHLLTAHPLPPEDQIRIYVTPEREWTDGVLAQLEPYQEELRFEIVRDPSKANVIIGEVGSSFDRTRQALIEVGPRADLNLGTVILSFLSDERLLVRGAIIRLHKGDLGEEILIFA